MLFSTSDLPYLRVLVALLAGIDVLFVRATLAACRVRSVFFIHSCRGVCCVLVALLTGFDVLFMSAALHSGGLRVFFRPFGCGCTGCVLVALLSSTNMVFMGAVCDRILRHCTSPFCLVDDQAITYRLC